MVLYRAEPANGQLKPLRVDIDQIAIGSDPTTNYQLIPGDRLVIPYSTKGTAVEKSDSSDQHPATEGPTRNVLPLQFDRQPDDSDVSLEKTTRRR